MKKVLIANRGEIALRIIRSARELGIKTVAVHSECDATNLHVKMADESICIGGNRAKDSYLNIVALMSACDVSGADAVHPGYGFLSEQAHFASTVAECGITFIGPKPDSMRKLGSKVSAREIVSKSGVPVLPGSGVLKSVEDALSISKDIGFPVLLKASNGGGGRGMRIVRSEDELKRAFESAQSESKAAFGSGDIFVEKFVEKPRHIEIQILADRYGNVIHLGERECSLQRRHQKVIEEAPSMHLDEELRQRMGKAACAVASSVNYESLGTCEFLLDEQKNFYFMETNTRIQVEHPVTEFVTGIDLVKEQFYVAMGERLRYKQSDIKLTGHAIECRVNAEDPYSFMPSPGKIENLIWAGGLGVRIDSGVYPGFSVPPFYDSMLAKVICYGHDRKESRAKMLRALRECVVEGIKTNIPLHKKILEHEDYVSGDTYTKWIEEKLLV
ncbi:MAG: acetyl-CoA carboxylase biotin carboxylase subunit [bacterium]